MGGKEGACAWRAEMWLVSRRPSASRRRQGGEMVARVEGHVDTTHGRRGASGTS